MSVSATSLSYTPAVGSCGSAFQRGRRTLAVLAVLAVGCYQPARAQSPAWRWLAQATEGGAAQGQQVATDAAGNAYVAGRFTNRITLGSFELQSAGRSDIFVAKVTPDGRWAWAVSAGGTAGDGATGIALNREGDVVVAGSFQETAQFGPLAKQSRGSDDVFVARLTSGGEWLGVSVAGGPDQDLGLALTLDAEQNVFVGGRFRGKAVFGGSTLTSAKDDAFIAKLGPLGQWQWANQTHSGTQAAVGSLGVDKAGAVYAAGYFEGPTVWGHQLLQGRGTHDAFVAKMSAAGSWQWATAGGGASTDYAKSLAVHDDGNIYVTGSYSGQATFGAFGLTSHGGDDAYVAQLDARGQWQWVRSLQSTALDNASAVSLGPDGSLYVSGSFSGGGQYEGHGLANNGGTDVFVTRLSKTGQLLDVLVMGGAAADQAQALAAGPDGSVFVVGNVGAARAATAAPGPAARLFIGKAYFPAPLAAGL